MRNSDHPPRAHRALSALLLLTLASPLSAQTSLDEAVKAFGAANIKGYMQPVADALTASLSSGFFANASPSRKFGLSLELVGAATMISSEMKTFTAVTPTGFQPTTVQAPTIFGGKATAVNNSAQPGLSYRTSDGILDAKLLPTAIPQIRISGVAGTELVVRYFSSSFMSSAYKSEDLPELKTYAVALRHGLNQYFGELPVELAVSASWHSLTFGDLADATGLSFGANVGKNFGPLSLLGGVESSGGTMKLAYASTDPNTTGAVNVDLKAQNNVRAVAGFTLNAKIFKLFGTAGIGSFTTYSGGLRIGR
jgi:hypothetical protein